MPAKVEGRTVRVGEHALTLDYAPKTSAAAKVELGIRPEFIRVGREGMPVTVSKVEDIGLGRRSSARSLLKPADRDRRP